MFVFYLQLSHIRVPLKMRISPLIRTLIGPSYIKKCTKILLRSGHLAFGHFYNSMSATERSHYTVNRKIFIVKIFSDNMGNCKN